MFDQEAEAFFQWLEEFRTYGVDPAIIQRWADHADNRFRRNRRQVVVGFPVVAQMIAHYPQVPLHMEIAAIIDRGDPLIDKLTTLLGVRKNSVRFLRGKGPSLLGENWMDSPGDLFRAVDMIAPERRPRTGPDWAQMRVFWVDCGLARDKGFCSRPESFSAVALKQYVFAGLCAKGYVASARLLARLWERDRFRLTDMKDYFRFAGQWCQAVANLHQHNEHVRYVSEYRVRDELLMRYSVTELMRQSQRWHRLIGQNVVEDRVVDDDVDGADQWTWPGLPGLPVKIGDFEVVSLTDHGQIQLEGRRMNHCVGTYFYQCMSGSSHIVSIRNDRGESMSTVDLTLQTEPNGQVVPMVLEHRGYANEDPPCASVAVMNALLAMLRQREMTEPLLRLQQFHEDRAEEVNLMLWRQEPSIMDTKSAEIMEQVLPDYSKANDWLLRILAEEEIWHRYRNDQIGDEIIKPGLDDT